MKLIKLGRKPQLSSANVLYVWLDTTDCAHSMWSYHRLMRPNQASCANLASCLKIYVVKGGDSGFCPWCPVLFAEGLFNQYLIKIVETPHERSGFVLCLTFLFLLLPHFCQPSLTSRSPRVVPGYVSSCWVLENIKHVLPSLVELSLLGDGNAGCWGWEGSSPPRMR